MVYNRLQSSLESLAWPWSGRSLPMGNQWECRHPELGPNVVWLPVPLTPSDQPKPDRLIFCHMAGWLANCSWQAGWLADCLSNKMSTLASPMQRHLVAICDDFGHIDQRYSPVETSHGQVWSYCEQANLQSDVPLMRFQARFAFGQMSGKVNIIWDVPPQLKKSSGHRKMIDPHGQLLYHKRPFTWEGNYLVTQFTVF